MNVILSVSEESRPIHRLQNARSFGGVYPENIEGPQDDIATQSHKREVQDLAVLLDSGSRFLAKAGIMPAWPE